MQLVISIHYTLADDIDVLAGNEQELKDLIQRLNSHPLNLGGKIKLWTNNTGAFKRM